MERLFYGRRVLDKNGNPKSKEFWVGGIYGDPVHSIKKVFQQCVSATDSRAYEHWGMSWAITTSSDESNGGEGRREAKIAAKQPVYSRWLRTGEDVDLVEDCDRRDAGEEDPMGWVGREERRQEPGEGEVVEVEERARGEIKKEGGGRRLRLERV